MKRCSYSDGRHICGAPIDNDEDAVNDLCGKHVEILLSTEHEARDQRERFTNRGRMGRKCFNPAFTRGAIDPR